MDLLYFDKFMAFLSAIVYEGCRKFKYFMIRDLLDNKL